MKSLLLLVSCFLSFQQLFAQNLSATFVGRYTDGRDGACEISAYDATSQQLVTTNSAVDSIDLIDISMPSSPSKIGALAVSTYGGGVNSVVNLNNGYFAAAFEAPVKQDSGNISFFDWSGNFITSVKVGALPDMITVSPDGSKLLVACEGEPNDDYTIDPEGQIGIIDLNVGVSNLSQSDVTLLSFGNAPATIAGALKKPNTTWAADLEPEYIAVNQASTLAAVACQENNVLILVDLSADTILEYKGLGFKDHSTVGNGLDASNRDNGINIQNWAVKGAYQPDAIATYMVSGATYFVSANEGDARDYTGYSSETRIKDLVLDATAFPNAATLQGDATLGRLKTFTADMIGDTDGDGDVDELYSYGARSFSIWDANGNLVWDSGDDFEQYIAANYSSFFNCNDGLASEQDNRSDDKGPEPEAVTIGTIGNRSYAFIALERQGGIMVYDVSNPNSPNFELFINSYDVVNGTMIDIAPEGLVFVPATASHTGKNMLIVSNEVSGTTTIYEITDLLSNIAFVPSKSWSVYPNPAQELLTINWKENQLIDVEYRLVNTVGQEVLSGTITTDQTVLSVQDLPAGVYHLQVMQAQQFQFVEKIIKH